MTVIRTTYHGRLAQLRNNNTRLAGQLAEAQAQATTGLRVSRPSDDPGLVTRLARLREQQDNQQVYADNSEWASSVLSRADGALSGLADVLTRARELAVQLSSESYSDAERQTAAIEAQGIFDRALEYANAQFGGRYIFAGDDYGDPPYDATGAYTGAAAVLGSPDVPVADGLNVQIGFSGSDLLGTGPGDVVAAFANLVTNLTTGTPAAVQSSLDDIEAGLAQLSQARTIVGNEQLVAEDAYDLTIALDIELSDQISNDTEVDAAESYARLFEVQSAFEAALQVTASARTNLLFARI